MRILYITTIGITMGFFRPFLTELVNEGHVVDIATNEMNGEALVPEQYRELGCHIYPIDCSRSPFSKGNFKAVSQIRKIVETGNYDIVHCHTPNASVCTRLACRKARKNGTKVIYTAHGFHFYKGAPAINWLLYYPVEKYLSRFTDILITINEEDYKIASEKFHAKAVNYVPGVGLDTKKFSSCIIDKDQKRSELGIDSEAFLMVSVGELNANKNHATVIKALAQCKTKAIHYLIIGTGDLKEELLQLAESLHISDQVHLAGKRTDVPEVLKASDIFVFPSIREGRSVAQMEAMAAGLPMISSNNRGMNGVLKDHENALICDSHDQAAFARAILELYHDETLRKKLGESSQKLSEQFDKSIIHKKMKEIYNIK